MSILDLQKQISDADYRLKQQENLYQSTRTDRNNARSWMTRSSVSPNRPSATSNYSMASRSRRFVSSSKTRRLTPLAMDPASAARVRSQGDTVPAGSLKR